MKDRNRPKSDNWETPKSLYDELNEEFGFDFDPCPLGADFDGLTVEWGKSNFVNPPYSRGKKDAFIRKAYEEWQKGKTCVMLLPVATSTKTFHSYIYGKAEIRFLEGRVKFIGTNDKGEAVSTRCGMFDSMIVVFFLTRSVVIKNDWIVWRRADYGVHDIQNFNPKWGAGRLVIKAAIEQEKIKWKMMIYM